ncbi:MAG: hypothetical protein L6Q54_01985 [Leptospiraceae bacterium]|nr:hypothetical protein [Leptospiraceae bacterium]MCK6380009.1 hypothetical protein [Leptospiraceae bacterium]NUM40313.1 hypothetical protein [Leptospiraceae bacterium]
MKLIFKLVADKQLFQILWKTLIFIILFSINCCYDNNRIQEYDINRRIQVLIEAKAKECNNRPSYPLFFTKERSPSEVEKCEVDMILKTCPFNSYPWSCVRIF